MEVLVQAMSRINETSEKIGDVYKRQGLFMPDFDVTIVYEGNIETQEWFYLFTRQSAI